MREWFENIRFRISMWRYLRGKMQCDQCRGNFRRDTMTPTSGDWWLCDKCCQQMMAQWTRDIAEWKRNGSL